MAAPAGTLSLALAQVNPTVGDVAGNGDLIRAAARGMPDCDLIAFGELTLSGYPPEDLVLKGAFVDRIEKAVAELARETAEGAPALLVGAPWREDGTLYNAALLLADGTVAAVRHKYDLPNYGVFDEKRVFAAGPLPEPILFRGHRLGVMVCEDMWTPAPGRHLKARGADMLLVLNGSPFDISKWGVRRGLAAERVRETGLALAYVNLVGGQDELVFDGASFVLDREGQVALQLPSWRPAQARSRWHAGPDGGLLCTRELVVPRTEGLEAIYQALCVGLRDYVAKNRFPGVVLGLSGGIDSALTAAVAADALGPERVRCVMMPSPYTSPESLEDAAAVAGLLGTALDTIAIEPAMAAFLDMLAPAFAVRAADVTEENIQARARGIVLMALSNKLGLLLLTTGNKSEMSVGYATLYGDMCGGFSVLKDVYKTTVFALARWRNQIRPEGGRGPEGRVMPERVITKPPSAELKPNQTDQDTLPPYEVLDAILEQLIENDASVASVVAMGHDEATVRRVWRMVDRAEYKRGPAPPGVKITHRAFGRDRRYPITNRFTDLV